MKLKEKKKLKKDPIYYLSDENVDKLKKKLRNSRILLALTSASALLFNKPDTVASMDLGIKQFAIDNFGLFCSRVIENPMINIGLLMFAAYKLSDIIAYKTNLSVIKKARKELEDGDLTILSKKEKRILNIKHNLSKLALMTTAGLGWLATATNVNLNFLVANSIEPIVRNIFYLVEGAINDPLIATFFALPTIALYRETCKLRIALAKNKVKQSYLSKQTANSLSTNKIDDKTEDKKPIEKEKEQEAYV